MFSRSCNAKSSHGARAGVWGLVSFTWRRGVSGDVQHCWLSDCTVPRRNCVNRILWTAYRFWGMGSTVCISVGANSMKMENDSILKKKINQRHLSCIQPVHYGISGRYLSLSVIRMLLHKTGDLLSMSQTESTFFNTYCKGSGEEVRRCFPLSSWN